MEAKTFVLVADGARARLFVGAPGGSACVRRSRKNSSAPTCPAANSAATGLAAPTTVKARAGTRCSHPPIRTATRSGHSHTR